MEFEVIQRHRDFGGNRRYGKNEIVVTLSKLSQHSKNRRYSFRVVVGLGVKNAGFYNVGKSSSGRVVFIPSDDGYKFVNPGGQTRVMRIDLTDEAAKALPRDIVTRVNADAEGKIELKATIDDKQRIWVNG